MKGTHSPTHVRVGEQKLAYEFRAGPNPVIVFEAGMGSGLSTWDNICPLVNDLAATLTYDRCGIGNSPYTSPDLTVREMAQRLALLIDAKVSGQPLILVGYSLGGMIVRSAYEILKDRVVGIILLDPSVEICAQDTHDEPLVSPIFYARAFYHDLMRSDRRHHHELKAWRRACSAWRNQPPQAPTCPVWVVRADQAVPRIVRTLYPPLRRLFWQRWEAINDMTMSLPHGNVIDVSATHRLPTESPEIVVEIIRSFLGALNEMNKTENR